QLGFPCAAGRNPAFETHAAAAGLPVLPLPLYRVEADPAPALPPEPLDVLLFGAPSAVAAFRDGTWRPAGVRHCAIGPTTAQALRDAGLPVDAAAAGASIAAIVQTLREVHHVRPS
ncbi:MAG: hypothetical protein FJ265_21685, partial [Planctomycetes bacterium]|nr:hypothetical protein [Planctomycetota bacterium]